MYAIIRTGGKQYRVAENDVITVEKLPEEAGATVEIRDVLLLGEGENVTVGAPLVADARVTAEVVEQTKGDKIIIFKKRRRKHYRRKRGHRQLLTRLRITGVSVGA